MLLPPPPSAAPGGGPAEPAVPPGEAQSPGQTFHSAHPALWVTALEPPSGLNPRGLQGNLWDLTTGNRTVTAKGEGLAKTSALVWADQCLTCGV